jgi:hypothetical protein
MLDLTPINTLTPLSAYFKEQNKTQAVKQKSENEVQHVKRSLREETLKRYTAI